MIPCTCPTYQGVKIHWDFCPNDLMPSDEEVLAFHGWYGHPTDYLGDETELDEYNKRFMFFIRGFRAGRK